MESNSTLVSIGMPVYNSEKYLEKALCAILSQTYSHLEVIISDNASTDRTGEICRTFASTDKRIRYYRNETNLGASRNFGLVFELSKGTYFRWATYDDLMAPEAIERCLEVLEREPGVVLCYTKTINIDENDDVLDYYEDDFSFSSPDPSRRFYDFIRRIYPYNCNAMFGLIRRSALEATSLIGSYHSSDKVLLAQLVLQGQFREVPEYLFFKRFHPGVSTTALKTEKEYAEWHDSSLKGRRVFPRLKRTAEFGRSIHDSPLHRREKAACYSYLAGFYLLEWKRWALLGKEFMKRGHLAA